MCDHSFDEWLGKLANAWCCRTKFPEILDPLGPFAMLKIAPEMVLDRRFARSSSLAHRNQLLRSSDMTLVTCTAARAASVPRLIPLSMQRSRDWLSLSNLSTPFITG